MLLLVQNNVVPLSRTEMSRAPETCKKADVLVGVCAFVVQENTVECIQKALEKAKVDKSQLDAVGITNQRESVLVWNK